MTIDELKQWLVQAITGVYRRTVHRSIVIAPVAAVGPPSAIYVR